jgi:hypothetical protein
MRYLLLIHRYLGIAVSVLMVTWTLSGVVMLYVSYPSLPEAMRIAALQPLDLSGCCETAGLTTIPPEAQIADIRIEMLDGRAVANIGTSSGKQTIDLETGMALPSVGIEGATAAARSFAARWNLPAEFSSVTKIADDQWTVSGQFKHDRPLYKFAWSDAKQSELYVSSASGAAVQFTTRSIRFWNWLGAVPHWVYFTTLRRHVEGWAQFVIITSLLGCFLTVTGIYIGFHKYLHRPPNRFSPYRGFKAWHHISGLIFGLFALMWVMSGLISMNPWGLLESTGAQSEIGLLQGPPPIWRDLQHALLKFAKQPILKEIVSLQSANFHGTIFFVATYPDGQRVRLDANGTMAPLSTRDLIVEARVLGGGYQQLPELMHEADDLYFSHHSESVSFPVYRLLAKNGDQTRYYLDPLSGEILKKIDGNARAYRWMHEALHRLDFSPAMRSRPGWDILMLCLLAGVSLLTLTGCYAAVRRVIPSRANSEGGAR